MIRIAIVEDEKEYQDTLLSYIKRYREEHFADIATSVFSDGMDLVDDYHGGFDILLMDIKMKHLDGMKAARKIRSMDQAVVIIFITTMAQYAVAGYEVDALDFILKPIDYGRFEPKLTKAIGVVEKQGKKKYVMLQKDGRREKVSSDDILYIEVRNHNVYYVTAHETYTMRSSMAEAEKEFADYHFSRCNQAYLVNLKNVISVDKDDVQVGTYHLPFSKSRKKPFLQELSQFLEAGYDR